LDFGVRRNTYFKFIDIDLLLHVLVKENTGACHYYIVDETI